MEGAEPELPTYEGADEGPPVLPMAPEGVVAPLVVLPPEGEEGVTELVTLPEGELTLLTLPPLVTVPL